MNVEEAREFLGVSAGATDEEIETAYQEKVKQYHPDISDEPDAREKFLKLQDAKSLLDKSKNSTTERTRSSGDRSMGGRRSDGRGFELFEVLVLPVAAVLELAAAAAGERVVVGAAVEFALLDEALVDERVEVRIQPTVVDLLLVVVLQFVLDRQSVWFVGPRDDVQQITLESCEVIHRNVRSIVILLFK